MCGPKGYGFSAVLVKNKVSIWAILVLSAVWFQLSSPKLVMFLKKKLLFHRYR